MMPDIPAATPPLARLIQGGRGGEARLKLYLLLTMIATRYPFDIRNPPTAMTLARTLDLAPDTGARRITNNMKWLADNQFIWLTKRPGQTSSIQLLDLRDPQSSGKWTLSDPAAGDPTLASLSGSGATDGCYIVPVAIAVLFALREHLGGSKVPRYLLRDRRDSYGLSHDTWTRGRRELEEAGLLTVKRVPQGDEYVYNRLRNSYWLEMGRLHTQAAEDQAILRLTIFNSRGY